MIFPFPYYNVIPKIENSKGRAVHFAKRDTKNCVGESEGGAGIPSP